MSYSGGQQVVVIVSSDAEWEAVKRHVNPPEIKSSPYNEWFHADQFGQEGIIFYHGGWGKISAAATTQYIIDRWSPTLIVNLGTCGGFAGKVTQGETLLVKRAVVYDIQERSGNNNEHIKYYSTDLDLSWLPDAFPFKVRQAIIASADQDLDGLIIDDLIGQYGAIAADWESGSIAWVCSRHNVRCLILRIVSDVVAKNGSPIYEDNSVFIESADRAIVDLIEEFPKLLYM